MSYPIFPARGVNLLDDPRRIQDDECVKAKNLIPMKPGILKKRPAMSFVGTFASNGTPSLKGTLGCPINVAYHPKPGGPTIYTYHSVASTASIATVYAALTTYSRGNVVLAPDGNHYTCVAGVNGTGTTGAASPPADVTGTYILDGTVYWAYTPTLVAGVGVSIDDLAAGTTTSQMLTGAFPRQPMGFAFQNKYYFFPGHPSQVACWEISYENSVTTITEVGFTGEGNAFSPSAACVYRNRAVYGNLGAGYESRVMFSDPYDMLRVGEFPLTATGRSFDVGPGDGDRVVALVPITQSEIGNASSESLLVLKEYSAYIITGEPDQTTTSGTTRELMFGDMVVSKISYDCGCASARTVASTPYGTFWAGHDDVWYFAKGSLPMRIGTKIRPALAATAPIDRDRWHAAYFNGFYRLAVMGHPQDIDMRTQQGWGSGAAGPDDTYSSSTSGTSNLWSLYSQGGSGIIQNSCADQWWLDLRNGPSQDAMESRWWGPQRFGTHPAPFQSPAGTFVNGAFRHTMPIGIETTFGTVCMYLDTRPGKPVRLLGLVENGTIPPGRTCWQVEFDLDYTRDLENHPKTADAVAYDYHGDQGTAISAELLTKEYDFGEPRKQKGFINLEMDVLTSVTDYMNLEVIANGGETLERVSQVIYGEGFDIGADTISTDSIYRKFQQIAIWPTPTTSKVGSILQFRLYDYPGYVIDATCDLLYMSRGGVTGVIMELTHGYYASFYELIEHVTQVVTAQLSAGSFLFTHNWTGNHIGCRPTNGTWTLTCVNLGTIIHFISNPTGEQATAAELVRCRKLGALLGFDTSANTVSGTSHTSEVGIYAYRTSAWEFGDLAVEVRLFERGPA